MKAMSKSDINRFTSKLYRFLEQGHKVELKKMRVYRGFIYTKPNPTWIYLDPSHKIIPTLIHEALHYFYPQASERWVLKMEAEIVKKLSSRQMKNILIRFVKSI